MKAIGYQKSLPIQNEQSLQDIELEVPKATGRDILVEVKAIAVNPVDYKIRLRAEPEQGQWKTLGWDAAGIVKEVGEEVSLFQCWRRSLVCRRYHTSGKLCGIPIGG